MSIPLELDEASPYGIESAYQAGGAAIGVLDPNQLDEVRSLLARFDPDLERVLVAEVFGRVFMRPQLSAQDRQLIVIAALIAGKDVDQLRWHIRAALRLQLSVDSIFAVLCLAIPFCGWPAGIGAIRALAEVLDQDGISHQAKRGLTDQHWVETDNVRESAGYHECARIYEKPEDLLTVVQSFHALGGRFVVHGIFSLFYGRNDISSELRQLCAIAILVSLQRLPQLKSHIKGALRVGCEEEQIRESIFAVHPYTGWPATLNGFSTLQECL